MKTYIFLFEIGHDSKLQSLYVPALLSDDQRGEVDDLIMFLELGIGLHQISQTWYQNFVLKFVDFFLKLVELVDFDFLFKYTFKHKIVSKHVFNLTFSLLPIETEFFTSTDPALTINILLMHHYLRFFIQATQDIEQRIFLKRSLRILKLLQLARCQFQIMELILDQCDLVHNFLGKVVNF